jgi:thioredoxin-like negative regulator of GroEL
MSSDVGARLGLIVGILVAFGSAASNAAAGEPVAGNHVVWNKDIKQAWAETKATQRPLLVFIVSEGCVFCERMEQHTYANERLARAAKEGFIVSKVQASQNPNFVKQLNIRVYPATVIIAPDGRVLDQIDGFVPAIQLEERLATASKTLR